VGHNARYERPTEVELLIGNPAKATRQFGRPPKVKFKESVKIMTEADPELTKREAHIAARRCLDGKRL
jgi:GDPmannose 4,6-dehydratase